jgi:hypothetical protein
MELIMKKTKNAHYVDNKKFYAAMKEWKAEWDEAVAKGDPKPQCPNYLGECFVKISNHLAYKSNFVNYTFRDEMILDGIENCLRYADRFNPEKSDNPFAYFTQITYYSFVRRIKKEARQTETKLNYFQNIDLQQLLDEIEGDGHNYEYLTWVREQVDNNMKEKAQLDSIIPEAAKIKRRPKYFDEKDEETLDIDV